VEEGGTKKNLVDASREGNGAERRRNVTAPLVKGFPWPSASNPDALTLQTRRARQAPATPGSEPHCREITVFRSEVGDGVLRPASSNLRSLAARATKRSNPQHRPAPLPSATQP
jgi:hypothetical protein